jgi:hypothetical protein
LSFKIKEINFIFKIIHFSPNLLYPFCDYIIEMQFQTIFNLKIMKLLDLFFPKKAVLILFSILILDGLFAEIAAQTNKKSAWFLPRHQINVMAGTGDAGGIGDHNYPGGHTALGLGYTYHITQHWFGSIDFQLINTDFNLFSRENALLDLPSLEKPLKVQIRTLSDAGNGYVLSETQNLFELTNNLGYARRQNYSFDFGYMTVTNRNILRIGVGGTYSTFVGRHGSSELSSLANLLYVNKAEEKIWAVNLMASYDFFINQNLSIGLRFNGLIKDFPPVNGCLTLGYAPVFKDRMKKKPRV